MERELWRVISAAIAVLHRRTPRPRYRHAVSVIVRVYLWAVLHDRPICWACRRDNWVGVRPPRRLPSQPTMSRRLGRHDTLQMIDQLIHALDDPSLGQLCKYVDGKPLVVSRHSADRHATHGRGAGGKDRGYKLHAIYALSNRPLAWAITGLHAHEPRVADGLVQQLHDSGYLLADGNYDANDLYDRAARHGHQLLAKPRYRRAKGRGHRQHSPHCLAALSRLREPSPFLEQLLTMRRQVETRFANLCNFGGGLTCLPPWVRTPHRVVLWTAGKIIVRLARDRCRKPVAA